MSSHLPESASIKKNSSKFKLAWTGLSCIDWSEIVVNLFIFKSSIMIIVRTIIHTFYYTKQILQTFKINIKIMFTWIQYFNNADELTKNKCAKL